MCGIAGYIKFSLQELESSVLKNMTDALSHRGPDSGDHKVLKIEDCEIGLGHRRLSIIDLSESANQPMRYNEFVIIFNGEIYNYREIKKELEEAGYQFKTTSDTEVILVGFHHWGTDVLHRLNGMFAFAIINEQKKKVHLFRDRAGVKPLYYYFHEGHFLFASELKAFLHYPYFEKKIDVDSVAQFLQYGYIPVPNAIFQHTHKVRPGYFIEIDLKSQELTEAKYWDVWDYYNKPKLKCSEEEVLEQTETLMESSFRYRMVADVPVGVFLSGGYDSSAVTALLQKGMTDKLKTFTIGFDVPEFNEAPYAKQVAEFLKTDHTEVICTEKEAQAIIPELPYYFDEPFADHSAIPTILVSRIARQNVTVALSADGADELFSGYRRHENLYHHTNRLLKIPKGARGLVGAGLTLGRPFMSMLANKESRKHHNYQVLTRAMSGNNANAFFLLQHSSQMFLQSDLKNVLKNNFSKSHSYFEEFEKLNGNTDIMDQLLAMDYKTFMLDDILTKVDRATMSVSLEGREPFLDYRLTEYLATVPSSLKFKNLQKKYLLKKIVHKHIPREIMERPKMGFGVPVFKWFRTHLRDILESHINEDRLGKEGIFDVAEVLRLKEKYLKGDDNSFQKVWFFLVFQMWYDQWMNKS